MTFLTLARLRSDLFRATALALLVAPAACSQTTEPLSDVEIDAVTRTTARVTWKSSRPSAFQILYGESNSYGMTMKTFILRAGSQYSAFLSGLRSGTTYYLCPQATDGEKSICDGQKNNFKFTTVSGGFQEAALPRHTVDAGQPELTGEKFPVKDDCSDLQEQIDKAADANPDKNHEVRIPPAAVCHGQYLLRERGGPSEASGWITIRGDIPDDELPPQGVQIDRTYSSRMPVIRSNYVSAWYASNPPNGCVQGDFWWKSESSEWGLYRCADPGGGPKWEPIPAAGSGTTVPKECSPGDWYFKSDESDRQRQAWWCVAPNSYQNVYFDSGSYFRDFAAIRAEQNAHHYRIQGVQITHMPVPESYGELFNSKNARKKGILSGCLAMTPASSHHVTFDRVWFRGQDYPAALWYAFCMWEGSYQAIVNSLFSDVNRWVHPESLEDDSRAINIEQGPGPGLIENNMFENAVGITLFISDDAGDRVTVPADYTIRRNRFVLADAYNALSPQSNGRHYYRRHHLELKRGVRFLVEGNIFEGGWTAQNLGASVVLTPRTGPSADPKNKIVISDFVFRNNVLRNAPEAFLIIGHTDSGQHHTMATQRVAILNNMVYGLSGARTGWGGERKAVGQFLNMGLGIEDLKIQHNTIFDSQGDCCLPNFLSHAWDEPNAGLDARYNIFTFRSRDPRVGIWLGGGYEGTDALNRMWRSGASAEYTVTDNVLMRPGGDPGTYPRGNHFVDNANGIGFDGQLQLTESSQFRGGKSRGATDGKDMGADIVQVKKAVHVIEDMQLAEWGSERAVIAYKFFSDAEGMHCAVDLSEQANFTPFVRYWDNGQSERRLAELTGLKPGSEYKVRVQCGGATSLAVLRTDVAPERKPRSTTSEAAKQQRGNTGLNVEKATPVFPELEIPAAKGKKGAKR